MSSDVTATRHSPASIDRMLDTQRAAVQQRREQQTVNQQKDQKVAEAKAVVARREAYTEIHAKEKVSAAEDARLADKAKVFRDELEKSAQAFQIARDKATEASRTRNETNARAGDEARRVYRENQDAHKRHAQAIGAALNVKA